MGDKDRARPPEGGPGCEASPSAADGVFAESHPSREMCGNCLNARWVCENHPDLPWAGISANSFACDCGGAGMPCGACNLEAASAGYVERERQRIVAWLRAQDESYSGWNPHDEQFDNGFNSAIKWVGDSIEKRADTGFQPPEHGKVIRDIEAHLTAQGTEAGTAETGTGSVHDGPVAAGDAPKDPHHPPMSLDRNEGEL